MFKTEVKKALENYTYDRIKQKEGLVRVDFFCTLMDKDKEGMKQALKNLIHTYSCRDIFVSLEEVKGYTYILITKGDTYHKDASIFFRSF